MYPKKLVKKVLTGKQDGNCYLYTSYENLGNANGIGANATANLSLGSFNASYGFGASYFTKAHGTGKPGFETRSSYGGGITMGDFALRGYSTSFSGATSQRVGGIGGQIGDFGFRYENDGTPFSGWLGDGGDSYRTAAVEFGYKDFELGFKLFTGKRDYNLDTGIVGNMEYGSYGRRFPNGFVGEVGTPYRLGALYLGYRGNKIGMNSEHIRHAIQDQAIHNLKLGPFDKRQPGFENQSWDWKVYSQYQSFNRYSLW